MTTIYPLEQFNQMIIHGFDYQVPELVISNIYNLSMQVGSPDYIKTPIFKKREVPQKPSKRKNKEIKHEEDWGDFKVTKIEPKSGIQVYFDIIRSNINKLTDKNYIEMSTKIVETIHIMLNENSIDEINLIGESIFDIASSNRYYSKIYAELYAQLYKDFDFIRHNYESNISKWCELFKTISYVDPNENYDTFCENNKIHEKRKALASFYVNLMNCGIVSQSIIVQLTRQLLEKVIQYIVLDNKKHEVDEMTDIIAILFTKDNIHIHDENKTMIQQLAISKVKEYKSFTTKSLFIYMDLCEL